MKGIQAMSQLKNRMPEQADLESLPIVGAQPQNEKEEKYLREVLPYEFYNVEEPGLTHKFPYGSTQNQKTFEFFHGGTYRVPRHVARHVESCTTPLWAWRPDGTGKMIKQKVGEKPRFQMRQQFGK